MPDIKKGDLYDLSAVDTSSEWFDALATSDSVRIERIVSSGQVSAPGFWYDQPRDEWVAVLRGEAMLRFEHDAEPVRMTAGEYVVIPAHCRHRVEWTDPDRDTVWLAVHFDATYGAD